MSSDSCLPAGLSDCLKVVVEFSLPDVFRESSGSLAESSGGLLSIFLDSHLLDQPSVLEHMLGLRSCLGGPHDDV